MNLQRYNGIEPDDEGVYVLYEDVAPLLAESRSSWVSVKEKPPEDALSVLIFYDGHMSIGSYIKGQWFGIGSTFPIDVTHWMKPEPPVSP